MENPGSWLVWFVDRGGEVCGGFEGNVGVGEGFQAGCRVWGLGQCRRQFDEC